MTLRTTNPQMDSAKRIVRTVTAKDASVRILSLMTILVFLTMGCRLISEVLVPGNESSSAAGTAAPPTLEGPIFRDDFNGQLNHSWEWENEDASRYKVNEDGWLEITGGSENILAGGQQTNLLWMPLPEGDFVISIHLKSQPLFDFQRAGLLLYEDSENYISLSRGYCMQCILGGSGVFLEYNLNGSRGRYTAAADATDLYLMLVIEQGVVSSFHAVVAEQWQHLASLENDIHFKHVALSVTKESEWDNGYDIVGMFDFFEIRPSFHQEPTPPLFIY